MITIRHISLWLALILINYNTLSLFGQNLTEVDSEGRATVKAILPNATSVRFRGLPGSWGLNGINLLI